MDIAGTVAVVTGAASGIGAALAARLVAANARVVMVDLDVGGAQRVADEIGAVAVGGDVSDPSVIAAAVDRAESEYGPVDLYFANAGIPGGLGLDAPDERWDLAWDVNVMAHVRAAQLLVPKWLERGGGYFVTTASAAGLLTQIGSAPYAVTKHAAVGFAEWLSVTFGDRGIRVSCLCPMGVDTPLLRAGFDDPAQLAARAVTTSGSVLTPESVADTVLAALAEERFLILPHPEVLAFYRNKGFDYDRWIAGMRRYQTSLQAGAH